MAEYDDDQAAPAAPEPLGVGARLRAAREGEKLTIAQVAAETRIPQRHLHTIEAGNFSALPARTYAIGFSRTFAKMVGLDSDEVADAVRAELDAQEPRPHYRPPSFEPGDPARVPSRGLVWIVSGALVLLVVGGFVFMRTLFAPAIELPSLIADEEPAASAAPAQQRAGAPARQPAAAPSGTVVFTALEEGIWVKFYDADGKQLLQKQMTRGERYIVPANVEGPQLWTGRPDALAITIGGRPIPKLAEEQRTMKDVPVTARALLARPREPAPAATRSPTG